MVNDFDGLKLDCPPAICNPLPIFGIENAFWPNVFYLLLLTVAFWVLGILALYVKLDKCKCRRKSVKQLNKVNVAKDTDI